MNPLETFQKEAPEEAKTFKSKSPIPMASAIK